MNPETLSIFFSIVIALNVVTFVFMLRTVNRTNKERIQRMKQEQQIIYEVYSKICFDCGEEPLKNPTYKQMMKRIKDFKIDQIKQR